MAELWTPRPSLPAAALALSLQFAVFTTPAAPVVLYDSGAAHSITPYLEPVSVVRGRDLAGQSSPATRPAGNGLPIHTPELSAGPLPQTPVTPEVLARLQRLSRPVFLVGADAFSLSWLAGHRAELAEHGAVGFLVEAATESDLARAQATGERLALVPSSASQLAAALGLTRYPVLLSRQGIEQ